MLADLAQRGVNELHVEAGHRLNGSFVREGLVDEYLVYMAPRCWAAAGIWQPSARWCRSLMRWRCASPT